MVNLTKQMFDIKRRRPIWFDLMASSNKDKIQHVQESLTNDIKNALLTILEKAVIPPKDKDTDDRFNEIRTTFESDVRNGQFHGMYHPASAIAITFAPDTVEKIDYETLDSANVPFWSRSGGTRERSGRSISAITQSPLQGIFINRHGQSSRIATPARNSAEQNFHNDQCPAKEVVCSVTEATTEGVVLGVDVSLLGSEFHPRDEPKIVPSIAYEREIITSVLDYASYLHKLQISRPWRLGISILNVRGFQMSCANRFRDDLRPCSSENISVDPIIIHNDDDLRSFEAVGCKLKNAFDFIWREFGGKYSVNYDSAGNWTSRQS